MKRFLHLCALFCTLFVPTSSALVSQVNTSGVTLADRVAVAQRAMEQHDQTLGLWDRMRARLPFGTNSVAAQSRLGQQLALRKEWQELRNQYWDDLVAQGKMSAAERFMRENYKEVLGSGAALTALAAGGWKLGKHLRTRQGNNVPPVDTPDDTPPADDNVGPTDAEQQAAATKLQTLVRGFQARKKLKELQHEKSERAAMALEDPVVIKAVTRLQAQARGRAVRAENDQRKVDELERLSSMLKDGQDAPVRYENMLRVYSDDSGLMMKSHRNLAAKKWIEAQVALLRSKGEGYSPEARHLRSHLAAIEAKQPGYEALVARFLPTRKEVETKEAREKVAREKAARNNVAGTIQRLFRGRKGREVANGRRAFAARVNAGLHPIHDRPADFDQWPAAQQRAYDEDIENFLNNYRSWNFNQQFAALDDDAGFVMPANFADLPQNKRREWMHFKQQFNEGVTAAMNGTKQRFELSEIAQAGYDYHQQMAQKLRGDAEEVEEEPGLSDSPADDDGDEPLSTFVNLPGGVDPDYNDFDTGGEQGSDDDAGWLDFTPTPSPAETPRDTQEAANAQDDAVMQNLYGQAAQRTTTEAAQREALPEGRPAVDTNGRNLAWEATQDGGIADVVTSDADPAPPVSRLRRTQSEGALDNNKRSNRLEGLTSVDDASSGPPQAWV